MASKSRNLVRVGSGVQFTPAAPYFFNDLAQNRISRLRANCAQIIVPAPWMRRPAFHYVFRRAEVSGDLLKADPVLRHRSPAPRPAQGDERHRGLPHGRARRPCRPLHGLRLYPDRLQLLPQSALPQVPGGSGQGMARRTPGRTATGRLLSRCLHADGADIAYQNKAAIYNILLGPAPRRSSPSPPTPSILAPALA